MLISKVIFFKKKYHFDAFQHEKHFKKQPQPHYQTGRLGHAECKHITRFI
jgi:hypothetical protein